MATIFGDANANQITGTDSADYIDAGDGNDTVAAKGGDDTVYGGFGNDRLDGGTGNDQLWGDTGTDILIGGSGDDYLVGGSGNDTYYIDSSGDVTIEGGSGGIDLVRVSADFYTLGYNIENGTVIGSVGLHLNGNKLNNVLTGGSGGDTLQGAAGNDKLLGRGGSDVLKGDDGIDILDGGSGRDHFYGGAGGDRFVFHNGDFAGLTASTSDVIYDFNHAEGDRIRLDQVDANSLVVGRQDFTFIGNAAFHDTAGELRYEQVSGDTYLYGDTNGDGAADFMIRVLGPHVFSASDLII